MRLRKCNPHTSYSRSVFVSVSIECYAPLRLQERTKCDWCMTHHSSCSPHETFRTPMRFAPGFCVDGISLLLPTVVAVLVRDISGMVAVMLPCLRLEEPNMSQLE
jgi:hypothetical protein